MWMPKSSYWTQPAGEAHITSAKGKNNIALVEIDSGPYLVIPTTDKFDNGERPYNIHASNILWNKNEGHQWASSWQDKNGNVTGTLLKFVHSLNLESENSRVVVINGGISTLGQVLNPGSLISVRQKSQLKLNCKLKDCIVYLKSNSPFKVL